jgi:hypothetical protein
MDILDLMPSLNFVPTPCPRCHAVTFTEAETTCRPMQDFTGEYTCPVGDQQAHADDLIRQPTMASIALLQAWSADGLARMAETERQEKMA